jgi:hypothetical protein
VKPRSVEAAEQAVFEATEQVIEQGGVVHEELLFDANEAALDGASTRVLVEYINGTRTEEYKPESRWKFNVERN